MTKFSFNAAIIAIAPVLLFSTFLTSSAQAEVQPIISLKSAGVQLSQAESALASGNVTEAYNIAYRLRPILKELTELHSQLFQSLKDDNFAKATAEKEKIATIEYAKLRDRANYISGVISVKQGNHLEAAKHLVNVIESQRTTELGEKAYKSLREIGFAEKLTIADQL